MFDKHNLMNEEKEEQGLTQQHEQHLKSIPPTAPRYRVFENVHDSQNRQADTILEKNFSSVPKFCLVSGGPKVFGMEHGQQISQLGQLCSSTYDQENYWTRTEPEGTEGGEGDEETSQSLYVDDDEEETPSSERLSPSQEDPEGRGAQENSSDSKVSEAEDIYLWTGGRTIGTNGTTDNNIAIICLGANG